MLLNTGHLNSSSQLLWVLEGDFKAIFRVLKSNGLMLLFILLAAATCCGFTVDCKAIIRVSKSNGLLLLPFCSQQPTVADSGS